MVMGEMANAAGLSTATYHALHVVYGTGFILMAVGISLYKKNAGNVELLKNFTILAIFASLFGLSEYARVPQYLGVTPFWPFDLLNLVLVSSAFAALLAFGFHTITTGSEELRWYRGLSIGAVIMYYWMLLYVGLDIFDTGTGVSYKVAYSAQQHSLGLAGAMVTGYAFYHLYNKTKVAIGSLAERYLFLGITFWMFALSVGLLEGEEILGFPLVVLNTFLAVMIALGMRWLFNLYAVPGK